MIKMRQKSCIQIVIWPFSCYSKLISPSYSRSPAICSCIMPMSLWKSILSSFVSRLPLDRAFLGDFVCFDPCDELTASRLRIDYGYRPLVPPSLKTDRFMVVLVVGLSLRASFALFPRLRCFLFFLSLTA